MDLEDALCVEDDDIPMDRHPFLGRLPLGRDRTVLALTASFTAGSPGISTVRVEAIPADQCFPSQEAAEEAFIRFMLDHAPYDDRYQPRAQDTMLEAAIIRIIAAGLDVAKTTRRGMANTVLMSPTTYARLHADPRAAPAYLSITPTAMQRNFAFIPHPAMPDDLGLVLYAGGNPPDHNAIIAESEGLWYLAINYRSSCHPAEYGRLLQL